MRIASKAMIDGGTDRAEPNEGKGLPGLCSGSASWGV